MRLNFNNIGRGLEAIAGAKQARDLAQTSARFDVTEGAYGPGLQGNITQLEGLKAQDPAQAAAYDQAIGELTRRQGLTAPDFSIASGPTNFATRQEARQAAAPMRAEGLAGVYRQYGDVAQADALEARAFDQQRAIAAEQRAVAGEARAQQTFAGGETERGLRINEATRIAAEQGNIISAREKLQTLRKDGPLTAAAISSVAGEFKLDPTKFLLAEDAVNTSEIKDLKRNLSSAALKGEDGLNKFLADKFDPDKTDNIKPMITKARDGSFVVTYGDRVLQEYGAHKNMMSLVGGVINIIDQNPFATLTTLSALETQAAARKSSESTTNLNNARAKGLAKDSATQAKIDDIDDQLAAIPPAERNGPAARGLILQRNSLVAGANKQVALPTADKAERPALSPADVTARAKALYEARTPSLNNPKKPMTMTEAISFVEGGMQNPIKERLDAALGDDTFAPPAAGGAPQQPGGLTRPAAAPARNAPAEPNPYVDARGRPLPVAPAGTPSIASTAIPAAASAVESAVGTQAAATRYLQAKIARNEPLTATDRARAVQLGLVRQ